MNSTTGRNPWHHAPPHQFIPNGIYMVTAATHHKAQLFSSPEALDYLLATIHEESQQVGWTLEAWAVFTNHYHIVARAPDQASSLPDLIRAIHSRTALWINKRDGQPGRKVWFNYWDTCLTFQRSYLARLNYVHSNPVKHGIVRAAEQYKWCSMDWFLRESNPAFRKTVLSFKTDKVNVPDDF